MSRKPHIQCLAGVLCTAVHQDSVTSCTSTHARRPAFVHITCMCVLWLSDVDECKLNNTLCGSMQCTNIEGSYKCLQSCRAGYKRTLDGKCIGKDTADGQLCHSYIFLVSSTWGTVSGDWTPLGSSLVSTWSTMPHNSSVLRRRLDSSHRHAMFLSFVGKEALRDDPKNVCETNWLKVKVST